MNAAISGASITLAASAASLCTSRNMFAGVTTGITITAPRATRSLQNSKAREFCTRVTPPVPTARRVNATRGSARHALRTWPALWAGNQLPAFRLRNCGCGILDSCGSSIFALSSPHPRVCILRGLPPVYPLPVFCLRSACMDRLSLLSLSPPPSPASGTEVCRALPVR